MDTTVPSALTEPTVPNCFKLFPKPLPGDYVVRDTYECYDDEEDRVNAFLALGYEPYAVTCAEIDERPEQKKMMQLRQVPIYRPKRWFRRERSATQEEISLAEIVGQKLSQHLKETV